MTDDIIDCWIPNEPDLSGIRQEVVDCIVDGFETISTESLTIWFKKELSEALREQVVRRGVCSISLDGSDNPAIVFHAACGEYEELTCREVLADELTELIDCYSEGEDLKYHPENIMKLTRLREVMSAAIDKIDAVIAAAN